MALSEFATTDGGKTMTANQRSKMEQEIAVRKKQEEVAAAQAELDARQAELDETRSELDGDAGAQAAKK